MKLLTYTEEGNNISGTITYIGKLEAFAKIESQDKDKVNTIEYEELIHSLLDFSFLYCVASKQSFDAESKTSVPMIFDDPKAGKCLKVFTCWRYAYEFREHYKNNDMHFLFLRKNEKTEGVYNSAFQIALALGVQNVLVNEGNHYIVLPIQDIIRIGGLSKEASQVISKTDADNAVNGKTELSISFNRGKCFQRTSDKLVYTFGTVWSMSYLDAFWTIVANLNHFSWFMLGQRPTPKSDIQWITDDEKIPDRNVFKTGLVKEASSIVIRGYNKVVEDVMEIEAFNQQKTVNVTVFDKNPDPKHYHDYQLNPREYENYMSSIEIVAQMEIARYNGMSLYKNYMQEQQGIRSLTEANKNQIGKGAFELHGFCPDLDKFDNGEEIKYPFIWKKDEDAFLQITKETMEKAFKVADSVTDIKKIEKDGKEKVCICLYSGRECYKEGHTDISSSDYDENIKKNKENGKTVTYTSLLNRSTFSKNCTVCEDKCFHGDVCIRQLAGYLFYLRATDKPYYDKLMKKWEDAHKPKEPDTLVGTFTVYSRLLNAPNGELTNGPVECHDLLEAMSIQLGFLVGAPAELVKNTIKSEAIQEVKNHLSSVGRDRLSNKEEESWILYKPADGRKTGGMSAVMNALNALNKKSTATVQQTNDTASQGEEKQTH